MKNVTHCIAEGCDRIADVAVFGGEGVRAFRIHYCRRHARRWSDPVYIPQPATATVLAGRFWDSSRRDGAKVRP